MRASLSAARESLATITAQHCVDYLGAWRRDRDDWLHFLQTLPANIPVTKALAHLGFHSCTATED
jgi:hypothetical protein